MTFLLASSRLTSNVVRQSLSFPRGLLSSLSSSSQPLIELTETEIHPSDLKPYLKAAAETAELRISLEPIRFFSLPDVGGQLYLATCAYYFEGGHVEREAVRTASITNREWQAYLETSRRYFQSRRSNLFVEAPLVSEFDQVSGLKQVSKGKGPDCILELRRYHLKLGNDTVPKLLDYYAQGLPSKLSTLDPTSSLVTVLYSNVGRLNEVIEVWRHGNGTLAMEESSQVAARAAPEWTRAIDKIMADLTIEFTCTIHRPMPFSPLR